MILYGQVPHVVFATVKLVNGVEEVLDVDR